MKKFKRVIKKELLYYLLIFFLLAFALHIDLASNPLARLDLMREKENYFHPFFYTLIVYAGLLIIRKSIDLVVVIFKKITH